MTHYNELGWDRIRLSWSSSLVEMCGNCSVVWDLKFCATEDEVGSSASRFGNILPLWQYFDGFCSIWLNVWTYLAIIYAIGRIVFFVNVQILKKLSSHLVTLAWCSLVEFWSLSAIPDGQFSILAIVELQKHCVQQLTSLNQIVWQKSYTFGCSLLSRKSPPGPLST